ncbi:MAG: rhodanese-like domain-containing protein [Candidatus Bathyarchaeota archaeon]|nr:rhodanese-like domain-containing protein [Candidatus Bathyarchaeota archaeon]
MSETDEIYQVVRKYWKILVKWFLRIHDYPEITVDELHRKLESGDSPLLIDIRPESDYRGTGTSKYGHIPDAISIPMLELETKLQELEEYREKEIITMCPGGGLSLAAVEVMQEAGFRDVKSLKGGTDAWHKKGYPTVTG